MVCGNRSAYCIAQNEAILTSNRIGKDCYHNPILIGFSSVVGEVKVLFDVYVDMKMRWWCQSRLWLVNRWWDCGKTVGRFLVSVRKTSGYQSKGCTTGLWFYESVRGCGLWLILSLTGSWFWRMHHRLYGKGLVVMGKVVLVTLVGICNDFDLNVGKH